MLNMGLAQGRKNKMCKYDGCDADAGGQKKLYCGNQDDWVTCAYFRSREVAVLRVKNKKKGLGRKVYKKICVYCKKPLTTKVHNQMSHGSQYDKKSCAYFHFIKRQQKYDEVRRKK